jgi:hypothetical protein
MIAGAGSCVIVHPWTAQDERILRSLADAEGSE